MSPRNYSRPVLRYHQPGKLQGIAGMTIFHLGKIWVSPTKQIWWLFSIAHICKILPQAVLTAGRHRLVDFHSKIGGFISATKRNLTSAVIWYCNCRAPAMHEATESLQWSLCKHCRPKQQNKLCTFSGLKANLQGLPYDTEFIWGHAKKPNGPTC